MEVRCDKCQARYRVDDARIGPQGLTMRCGKCQNTFKVTKPEAIPTVPEQAPVPPAPRAAPAAAKPAAEPAANATMVFGQSPVAPSKPAMPSASKPAAAAPRPAAAKPAATAPADEGAGRTMMFQTGNLKTSPPAAKPAPKPAPEGAASTGFGQSPAKAAPAAKPAGKGAEPASSSTMVFGQSPLAKPAVAMPAAKAAPTAAKPAARDDSAGSTIMFGASPALAKPAAAPARPAPAPIPAPEPEPEAPEEPAQEMAAEPAHDEQAAHEATPAGEAASDSGVEAEGSEESTEVERPADQGAFDKAPPKGLLIGMLGGIVVLALAGGALVAVKKLGKHPPPPAAVETLGSAQTEADKDTLASIASAEGKARDAIDVAGKSYFPEANATLARIEVQWADAFNDQAALVAAKGADGSEAKAAELQAQAKAKLKAAFEALSPALKADPKSPDLQVSLADYYRAQRSNSNMNKALKSAQALKADDARVSLVQGMAMAQEEDGAEKAIPKLKAALAASPNSARVHFRLALAYQAMKDDANASAELKQVLNLSPQHERAKLLMETTASADGK